MIPIFEPGESPVATHFIWALGVIGNWNWNVRKPENPLSSPTFHWECFNWKCELGWIDLDLFCSSGKHYLSQGCKQLLFFSVQLLHSGRRSPMWCDGWRSFEFFDPCLHGLVCLVLTDLVSFRQVFTFYGWQNLSGLAGRLWIPLVRVQSFWLGVHASRICLLAEWRHLLRRLSRFSTEKWDNFVQNDDFVVIIFISNLNVTADNMLLSKSLLLLDWQSKIDDVPPSRKFERRKSEIPNCTATNCEQIPPSYFVTKIWVWMNEV